MIDVATLSKEEIVKRSRWHCNHGHNGLDHSSCFDKEYNLYPQKVGFLDIEASNLNAPFGIIYTVCIKELDGAVFTRAISFKELNSLQYDKPLLSDVIKEMSKYERLIVHYGTSRKPRHQALFASDSWDILKSKFRLHSNRLEAACDFFGIPSKEHKLKPDIWLKMLSGNKKEMESAIAYILKHNIEDVMSLEALWKRISPYSKLTKTSI